MFGAIRHRGVDARWWLLLLLGALSMSAGVIAALYPGLTTLALILLMGAHALVSGVLEIVLAVRARKLIRGEWLLVLSGVVSVLFGVSCCCFRTAPGRWLWPG